MPVGIAARAHKSQEQLPAQRRLLPSDVIPRRVPILWDAPKDLNKRCGSDGPVRPPGRPQNDSKRHKPSQASAGLLVVAWAVLTSVGIAAAHEPKQLITAERYQIDISFQPEKGFLHARAAVAVRAAEVAQAIEFELNPHL